MTQDGVLERDSEDQMHGPAATLVLHAGLLRHRALLRGVQVPIAPHTLIDDDLTTQVQYICGVVVGCRGVVAFQVLRLLVFGA
jgi:hypothetical protein